MIRYASVEFIAAACRCLPYHACRAGYFAAYFVTSCFCATLMFCFAARVFRAAPLLRHAASFSFRHTTLSIFLRYASPFTLILMQMPCSRLMPLMLSLMLPRRARRMKARHPSSSARLFSRCARYARDVVITILHVLFDVCRDARYATRCHGC